MSACRRRELSHAFWAVRQQVGNPKLGGHVDRLREAGPLNHPGDLLLRACLRHDDDLVDYEDLSNHRDTEAQRREHIKWEIASSSLISNSSILCASVSLCLCGLLPLLIV